MLRKIGVFSIDHDGCLNNRRESDEPKMILAKREKLISYLIERIEKNGYSEVVLMVGSNRQDIILDRMNCENNFNISCFPLISALKDLLQTQLSEELKVTLDPLLLADVFSNKASGYAFNLATKESGTGKSCCGIFAKKVKHPSTVLDPIKTNILFAQMHHIALTYSTPPAIIDYHFIDDEHSKILEPLNKIFNPLIIPTGVTLNLHHYACSEVGGPKLLFAPQKGLGHIDHGYAATLRRFCSEQIPFVKNAVSVSGEAYYFHKPLLEFYQAQQADAAPQSEESSAQEHSPLLAQ
ncbi:MAG: hypothetical protein K0S08_418 [Gammaproteobacteria bacterium]|nr:hypothetical protein [Gammaproteobacteria bacterium]